MSIIFIVSIGSFLSFQSRKCCVFSRLESGSMQKESYVKRSKRGIIKRLFSRAFLVEDDYANPCIDW